MTKEEAIRTTNEWFMKNATPPEDAMKPISGGRLNGMTDINPQWRIQALTEQYGICGVGWAYEIKEKEYIDVPATGEKMVFITVHLFIRDWNYPDEYKWIGNAIGIGGDFVVKKEKNGLFVNDECCAMALTDAIGKAAKVFGIANNVYRGKFGTKYQKRNNQNANEPQTNEPTTAPSNDGGAWASESQVKYINNLAKKGNIAMNSILQRYGVDQLESMSKAQASDCIRVLKKQVGE